MMILASVTNVSTIAIHFWGCPYHDDYYAKTGAPRPTPHPAPV